MVKNIKLRKVFALVALFATALTSFPVLNTVEASDVTLTLSNTEFSVKEGESISLKAYYACPNGIKVIALSNRSIQLPDGLTANVEVSATGNIRTITLSNIQAAGGTYTVKIPSGTARSSSATDGRANAASFKISVEGKAPTLTLSNPSSSTIYEGESVTFTATYANTTLIALSNRSIKLSEGLTADITVTGSGNTRTITLSNVKGSADGNTIYIPSGTGRNGNKINGRTNEVTSNLFKVIKKVSQAPVLKISNPNPAKVYAGETVTYTLTYTDDVKVKEITLKDSDITLNGFKADKKIVINKDNTVTLTLSNIQGEVGSKTISVAKGTAIDEDNNKANAANSVAFVIEKKVEEVKPEEPVKPEPQPEPVKPQPQKPSDWKDNPNTGI